MEALVSHGLFYQLFLFVGAFYYYNQVNNRHLEIFKKFSGCETSPLLCMWGSITEHITFVGISMVRFCFRLTSVLGRSASFQLSFIIHQLFGKTRYWVS